MRHTSHNNTRSSEDQQTKTIFFSLDNNTQNLRNRKLSKPNEKRPLSNKHKQLPP